MVRTRFPVCVFLCVCVRVCVRARARVACLGAHLLSPEESGGRCLSSFNVWLPTAARTGDTVDDSGEASHPNVLDMFERCRSAGLGGAVVLKQRSEEANNAFVVGRIDRAQYVTRDPAVFGDRLEVRSVVELKFNKAGKPSP